MTPTDVKRDMTQGQNLTEPLATFVEVFTRLAGHAHVIAASADPAPILHAVLDQHPTDTLAMTDLPPQLAAAAVAVCKARDIRLLQSPFPGLRLPDAVDSARVGVTMAAFAVAETGSIVELTRQDADRLVSSLPRVHICFLRHSSIVATLKDAAPLLREAFAPDGAVTATFISGPSRTGDIEMKLTLGVHGPEVMHVIILDV
jgi:L-lactate dehydrogenase complex protein LldG